MKHKAISLLFVAFIWCIFGETAQAKTYTTMTVNQGSCVLGSWIRLYAHIVRSDTRQPIGPVPIKFKLAGQTIGTVISSASGYATIDLNVTERFRPGVSAIYAEFAGDNYFRGSWDDAKMNVYKGNSNLSVTAPSGKVGSTVTLTATLKTDALSMTGSRTPIAGRRLTFEVDNRSIGSSTTSSAGIASLRYSIRQPGSHVLKVVFQDSDTYFKGKTGIANFWGSP